MKWVLYRGYDGLLLNATIDQGWIFANQYGIEITEEEMACFTPFARC
jgi:hypothetical protein